MIDICFYLKGRQYSGMMDVDTKECIFMFKGKRSVFDNMHDAIMHVIRERVSPVDLVSN